MLLLLSGHLFSLGSNLGEGQSLLVSPRQVYRFFF